ncbi:MAG: NTP transferase domain-containing protein, partial [Archaeoglobi archaeon]|nr:NTP transferase domain-containing protein [Archaeoglobi archaeon]
MKAVLLCSGLATRMGGRIKPLVKVGGREILYRTITLLRTHGIDEFVIVVNRKNKEAI